MTFEEYHEIHRKYRCQVMPFDISLNKFTKEEYEDMIRDYLQSGLVVRCLPPKEDDFFMAKGHKKIAGTYCYKGYGCKSRFCEFCCNGDKYEEIEVEDDF